MTASINIIHILAIAPLFFYIGSQRDKTPEWLLNSLAPLGAFILLYHAYRAYGKMQNGKSAWVNWIHILLVAPLLIWIGVYKNECPRSCFEILMMLGFAVLGYHGYYLISESLAA